MGRMIDKKIDIIRSWIDPTHEDPVPDLDYRAIYPVTSYAAVHKTLDDESATLEQELAAIYAKFDEKQDILSGGTPGRLVTWGSAAGDFGEMEVVQTINPDDTEQSYYKATSERSVGKALANKADARTMNDHIEDTNVHVTEEEKIRWNSMAPSQSVEEHMENTDIHTSAEEKASWNAKADGTEFTNHANNTTNPHHVNAHQTGTYTASEIDEMFSSVAESFFNYKNIQYDDKTGIAKLVEYNEDNWNPNYVLGYGEELPTPTDDSLTYFAIRPVTDYSTHVSDEVVIYMKEPTRSWREVGTSTLKAGDMVIRYPDTTMCVWLSGRFVFIDSVSEGSGDSNMLWRPILDADGTLTFVRSEETTAPDPVNIKGPAGYTPQKNIDYFDGADGIGIPDGGREGEFIIKAGDSDYDTKWMTFADFLDTYVDPEDLPALLADWNNIQNKPEIYQDLGDDTFGLVSQAGITNKFNEVSDAITEIQNILGGHGGVEGLIEKLDNHLLDYSNPHRVSASQIGAVSNETFLAHANSRLNPHNVTADQIGLGNVNNTSDIDKPISLATKEALDAINAQISDILERIGGDDQISSVTWDPITVTLTFVFFSGETLEVVFPINSIFEGMYWDNETSELVFPLPDGTEKRVKITDLVTTYVGGDTVNIHTTVTPEGVILAEIIPESVDGTVLAENIHLRGNPSTTTQPVDDNSQHIATTEFVKKNIVDNLESYDGTKMLSANMGRTLNATKASIQDVMDIIEHTPLVNIIDNLTTADPNLALSANMGRQLNLNKADKIHTSESGSTYGRASAQLFGHARAGEGDPLMDGVADAGTDNGFYARADHRHPTDSSRAPLHFPDDGTVKMTGNVQAETPPSDANDDRVATTKWVLDSGLVPSKTMIQAHMNDKNNPHEVNAEQLGLGNVLTDIGNIQEDLGAAKENIETLQTDLGMANSNIEAIQNDMSVLKETVPITDEFINTEADRIYNEIVPSEEAVG